MFVRLNYILIRTTVSSRYAVWRYPTLFINNLLSSFIYLLDRLKTSLGKLTTWHFRLNLKVDASCFEILKVQ